MKRKGPEVIADLKASNRATQMIPVLCSCSFSKLFLNLSTFGFVLRSLRPTIPKYSYAANQFAEIMSWGGGIRLFMTHEVERRRA